MKFATQLPPRRDVGTLLLADLGERLPGAVLELTRERGTVTLRVAPERLEDLARFLKEERPWQFAYLANLSPVDWLSRAPRFEVVYHLRSLAFNYLVALRVDVPDETLSLPSLAGVWRAADWLEREAYDLFGIRFAGHPDLRRIMMPDDWEGHPYRRDYPLAGRAGA
ncbi:MAG TPA: NADH-quinone oxidoreductase subunit C [bacterium]